MKFKTILETLQSLNREQLIQLNQASAEEWKKRGREIKLSLKKGDRVWFNNKAGRRIDGVVMRRGKINVVVSDSANDGMQWRVPPALLKRR